MNIIIIMDPSQLLNETKTGNPNSCKPQTSNKGIVRNMAAMNTPRIIIKPALAVPDANFANTVFIILISPKVVFRFLQSKLIYRLIIFLRFRRGLCLGC